MKEKEMGLCEMQEQQKQNAEYEEEMARRKIQLRLQFQQELNEQIQSKNLQAVIDILLLTLISVKIFVIFFSSDNIFKGMECGKRNGTKKSDRKYEPGFKRSKRKTA